MEILTNILNPVDDETAELLNNHIVDIEKGKIVSVKPLSKGKKKNKVKDFSKSICIPALIDAHTHLPQFDIVGKYGYGLIEFLQNYAFPAEIRFKELNYAKDLSKRFFQELKKCGTGTAVIYSSIHKESTEIAFKEADKSKLRIFMGKTMMNQNCPKELCENTIQSLNESYQLQKEWHEEDTKLQYIYSPRFAISTSQEFMEEVGKMARLNKTFLQTHINGSKEEREFAMNMYKDSDSYAEIYQKARILGPKTLLAHAIHNSKKDLEILGKTGTNVIHCPDANIFLKSGIFPLKDIEDHGISIGLGSDVGAGTTLDMFKIMKSMLDMQDYIMPVEKPFFHATKGNAKILDIDSGELMEGKNAELLKIDFLGKVDSKNAKNILERLIFTQDYKRELLLF